MSCIAHQSTNKGVLNNVMVVVLLGCVGLTAGLAYGTLFSSHESFSNSCRTGMGPQPWCSPSNLRPEGRPGVTVVMPAKSTYTFPVRFTSAAEQVRLFRGDHSGVREVVRGERVIELTSTALTPAGRSQVCMIARRHCDDYTAQWLAMRQTVQRTLMGDAGRPYQVIWHMPLPAGFSSAARSVRSPSAATLGRLPIGDYVLFGLLAGLSAALGFLMPPSRVDVMKT